MKLRPPRIHIKDQLQSLILINKARDVQVVLLTFSRKRKVIIGTAQRYAKLISLQRGNTEPDTHSLLQFDQTSNQLPLSSVVEKYSFSPAIEVTSLELEALLIRVFGLSAQIDQKIDALLAKIYALLRVQNDSHQCQRVIPPRDLKMDQLVKVPIFCTEIQSLTWLQPHLLRKISLHL